MNKSFTSLSNKSVPNRGQHSKVLHDFWNSCPTFNISPQFIQAGGGDWTLTHLLAAQHATTIHRLDFSKVALDAKFTSLKDFT